MNEMDMITSITSKQAEFGYVQILVLLLSTTNKSTKGVMYLLIMSQII